MYKNDFWCHFICLIGPKNSLWEGGPAALSVWGNLYQLFPNVPVRSESLCLSASISQVSELSVFIWGFALGTGCMHRKAPRRSWGLGWARKVPRAALQVRLVPSLLCHHQSLRAITTHQQFLEIRLSQLGEESLWYFPALLSKYAITILWTFTAPFHTRGWVLHKHSFPKPHTTHWRKQGFYCTSFYKLNLPKKLSTHFAYARQLIFCERSAVSKLPLWMAMANIGNVCPSPAPECLRRGLVQVCTHKAQTLVNCLSPIYNPQGSSWASWWEFFWQSKISSKPPWF